VSPLAPICIAAACRQWHFAAAATEGAGGAPAEPGSMDATKPTWRHWCMCRLLTMAQPTLVRAARSGKAAAVRVAAVQVPIQLLLDEQRHQQGLSLSPGLRRNAESQWAQLLILGSS
jgi:hypothetical protein